MPSTEKIIVDKLKTINLDSKSIVDLDLIKTLALDQDKISIVFNSLKLNPDQIKLLEDQITEALLSLSDIKHVKFRYSDAVEEPVEQKEPKRNFYFSNYDKVILIASGKGGVGKSTFTANLALALKKIGKTVSIFDADIYGPSIPLLMGVLNAQAKIENDKITPLKSFGIEFMSIGNIINEKDAVAWRGPMVHQAIDQLMRDTAFSGGDYMLIDMPPGTGDVQITISQLTSSFGALIVCTPQDLALLDARRAISMFQKVNIPIIGIVENMSSFVCPQCGEATNLFGAGGAEKESSKLGVNFLGSMPLDMQIRVGSDSGNPVVHENSNSLISNIFVSIASKL